MREAKINNNATKQAIAFPTEKGLSNRPTKRQSVVFGERLARDFSPPKQSPCLRTLSQRKLLREPRLKELNK